jgi:hypothetical protein
MAKSQRRSNRETKKPKKTAAERSKNLGSALTAQIAGTPLVSPSYKDRFK